MSSNPDFNYYIFQQEGKLVELWYLDAFADLLHMDSSSTTATGYIHKYLRNLVLDHFGSEILKARLLSMMEALIHQKLNDWSRQPVIEVKNSISLMIYDLTAKLLFSYESKEGRNLSELFGNFLQGLMSFPLNIPGTAFHKCKTNQKKVINLMRDILSQKRASPEKCKRDLLDQVIDDMKTETFLTDDFVLYIMFGLLLASSETISSTLTLAIKLLTDHPYVVQELTKEHVAILNSRETTASAGVTWNEYKSMTFTSHVINESLRLASVAPGIMRRAIKDIEVDGYTIPKGWVIMVVPAALQLNPNTYDDPLVFNPWRWTAMGQNFTAKNFIPFGGGNRSCAGAEFSKALMAVFFHVLVTNYSWTKVRGGDVVRSPALGFGNGFHIKVSESMGDNRQQATPSH